MNALLPTVLLEAALKGAVIFVIAAVAAGLLRHRSAAVRHAVWCFAVCAQLLLPVFIAFAPQWRVPLVAPTPWAVTILGGGAEARTAPSPSVASTSQTASPAAEVISSATQGSGREPLSTDTKQQDISDRTLDRLSLVWLIGASLVILHLAIGTIGVWRLAARGRRVLDANWLALSQEVAVRLGISRPMTLLGGDTLAIPVTWGVIYPVVLLPTDAASWDDEQRRYVLVHEMAHVRRFDALTQVIGQVTLALFWFNPLVWLAVARMRAEREHACDDYVLQTGTTPSRYANDLLTMVESIGRPNHRAVHSAFAALAMARRSEFEGRMVAILRDETDRAALSHRAIILGSAAAALVALGLAGFTPLAAREAGRQTVHATAHATNAAKVKSTDTSRTRSVGLRIDSVEHKQRHNTPLDDVLASLRPDNTKMAILAQYVVSGDTARLTAALRAVPSLSSDNQKNVVLANAARAALSGGDARLRDAYFTAVASMSSDTDLAAVLAHASANASGHPAVAIHILRAAEAIHSPASASMVLMNVAQRNLVTSDSIRTLYLRLARKIGTDEDKKRALIALLATPNSTSSKP